MITIRTFQALTLLLQNLPAVVVVMLGMWWGDPRHNRQANLGSALSASSIRVAGDG